MKITTTICFILLYSMICYAQVETPDTPAKWTELAKKDLESQKKVFDASKMEYDKLKKVFDSTPLGNKKEFEKAADDLRASTGVIDNLYAKREKAFSFYQTQGVKKEEMEKVFPMTYKPAVVEKTEEKPDVTESKAVSVIYGDGKIIKESVLKDPDFKPIFDDIFSEKSEAYLGDFEIPAHRQKIIVYNDNNVKADEIEKDSYYFEKIQLSIREGGLYEVLLTLTNKEGSQRYYFVNKVAIPILRYKDIGNDNFLYFSTSTPVTAKAEKDTTLDKDNCVKIFDVLRYYNNTGYNYVPEDQEFCFPPTNDTENATADSLRLYKIRQDTSLQNVMELRTYTDFLGLFDDNSPNGLVQIEGRADFYLAPFQIGEMMPFVLFKKTTPYVSFARIDEELKNIEPIESTVSPGMFMIESPLEILEKAYLDMGVVTDIFGLSFTKDFPFSINGYIPVRYKVASVGWPDGHEDNFKTVGWGFGARIDVKRFNNFGFTESVEWVKFNHLNRIDNLDMVQNFWTFRNQAEIFYFPGKSKQQSIFLRMRSYLNTTDSEDSFFQLQFGYRFAIGLGKKT